MAPDTPPYYDSPQAPVVTPGLPRSDPITAITLAELLKDAVKAIRATADASKTDDPQTTESADHSCALEFQIVDEVWDEKSYRYNIVESSKEAPKNSNYYVFVVRWRIGCP
ncbi:hypothetical protein K469DRAFT_696586 [Zopfia rhizophila CBS 207.26]|uniref:Uncharacterized protein n=1 Tax=Zopfia rhizophila CBS 207.26 TaxID=1314779 RepID=A0A6A6DJ19_9PEZI|nr:hypothetical protein K469DRAFT_696586 [Zopfia rhizophila CBS 207.26]